MISFRRLLIASIGLLTAVCFLVSVARATQSSLSFGAGEGTLYYTVTNTGGFCGPNGAYSYSESSYTNLNYQDPNGVDIVLGSGGNYIYGSPGPYPYGCPPNGGQPTEITYGGQSSGFIIQWYPGQGVGSANVAFTGYVYSNYQVVAVYYAPPGSHSYADYSETTMVGASTSISSSFQNTVSQSVTYGYSASSIYGTGSSSSTSGSSYTQEQDSSSSIDISYSKTQGYRLNGPTEDSLGLYHPADQIEVWLNPVVDVVLSSSGSVDWTGDSWDSRDPADNEDLARLTVYEMSDLSWFQQNDAQTWSRVEKTAWNPSAGLTDSDFTSILGHDPYSNSSPPVDTTRYQGPVNGGTIPYQGPGCPTCSPSTWYWTTSYQVTNSQGQGAKTSYSESYSTDYKYSIGAGWFSADLKNSDQLTWTNSWSSTETNKTSENATVSITGPAYGSGYTGPTALNMYQDNIYGTYMFYPVQ